MGPTKQKSAFKRAQNSDHVQNIIWAFAHHSYILYPILLANSEGPDQSVDAQADLDFHYLHIKLKGNGYFLSRGKSVKGLGMI